MEPLCRPVPDDQLALDVYLETGLARIWPPEAVYDLMIATNNQVVLLPILGISQTWAAGWYGCLLLD